MDTLAQDLRVALRSLVRRPGFTAGAVLTLALGIGAATSIFSVVNGVLLTSLPYAQPETLVRVWQTDRQAPQPPGGGSVSPASLTDWQERARSFAAIAQYTGARFTVTSFDEPEVMNGAVVTPEFFRVMRAEPLIGRGFTDEENAPGGPRAAVIGYGLWQERFGGARDVLGRAITIGGAAWEIVGVAPPELDFPANSRVWVPVRPPPACDRGCVYLNGIARLAPGVGVEQAQADMRRVALELEAEFPEAHTGLTLAVATLHDVVVGDVRHALWLLLGAVMLVVLIACANVANLLLVRGAQRSGELAVRAALGAGRGRLVRQILTESLVLALAGGALGVLLALWGVSALPALATENLPRVDEIALDARVVGFALGLVALTALLFGIVPALRLTRAPLASVVRQAGRGAANAPVRRWGRFALLTAEVGLSLVLLLGAGLLLRSFGELQRVPLGYDADGIVHFTLSLPGSRYAEPEDAVRFFAEVTERVAALPGVHAAAIAAGMPLGAAQIASDFTRTDAPPPPPGQALTARLSYVDAEFFRTLRIDVLRGRAFEATDRRGAMPVAVISRQAAQLYWPGEDPIGRQIVLGVGMGWAEDDPRTIVGIADDVRSVDVRSEPGPEIYVPHAQAGSAFASIVMRASGPPGPLLAAARDEVRARDPQLPLLYAGTLRANVAAQLADARFYLVVLALFAVLAVALAAVGIYSVVAFLVTRRTREIGVRMALGANPGSVVRSVVAEGVAPAAAGVIIGAAAAAAGTRVIASLLYETPAHDPLTYASASVLLLAVVALACALPARRAAAIPPTVALRQE